MKLALQDHYDRFKRLRAEGRDEEAMRQFNVTLKAAAELMEASTEVLKDLSKPKAKTDAPGYENVLQFPTSKMTH